ncbi:MAG: hypothetical protein JJ863_05420 [Deltaproteobacteria bacterium]|nr:hypothetical protein [Deltaproteobacteria bacterium]
MRGHTPTHAAVLAVATLVACSRSHGTDSDDVEGMDSGPVDAAAPDLPPPDMFNLSIALGCGWETIELSPGVSLRGVHGRQTAGLNPVWLVGDDGFAFGWADGPPLQTVQTDEGALLSSAWHDGEDSLWATELPGSMMRLSDDEWERFDSGVDEALLAVDGSSPDSAWAVGIRGVMAEWDGTSWSAHPSLVEHDLTGLSVVAVDDVWAVGSSDDGGVVLHFDGTEWSIEELDARLHDVSVKEPDDVWVVGSGVFHWDGARWSEEDVGSPGEWASVAVVGSQVWIAGVADRVLMRRFDGSWLTALEGTGPLWDMWLHTFSGDLWVTGEGVAHRCMPFFL